MTYAYWEAGGHDINSLKEKMIKESDWLNAEPNQEMSLQEGRSLNNCQEKELNMVDIMEEESENESQNEGKEEKFAEDSKEDETQI